MTLISHIKITGMLESRKKRGSLIHIEENPLEVGHSDYAVFKIENLSNTKLIKLEELNLIINKLKQLNDNDERLVLLEQEKIPYQFDSIHLLELLNITTSIKTKLAIIALIGPRLTDPKAKMNELIDIFRYANEKERVNEILKARIQNLNSSLFNKSTTLANVRQSTRLLASGRGAGRSPLSNNINSTNK